MKFTKKIKHSREASKEIKLYYDTVFNEFKNIELRPEDKLFLLILKEIINNKIDFDLWGVSYDVKDVDVKELKLLCKKYRVTSNIFKEQGLFSLTFNNIIKYNEPKEDIKILNMKKEIN